MPQAHAIAEADLGRTSQSVVAVGYRPQPRFDTDHTPTSPTVKSLVERY